ncbi:hypothetical protein DPMN_044051 [Dreissena polymorpha]|uniref:Uncharacterized protein n=1 Tax=Dreissena polymorpha TaxID=45954 RepID=A0A9D4D1P5_DREPO|nr:hypothetical protein DPMN_044051 [Dreissena polymorpha]
MLKYASADSATVPVFACPCLLLLLSGAKIAFAELVLLTEVTGAGAVSPEETPMKKISTACEDHTQDP